MTRGDGSGLAAPNSGQLDPLDEMRAVANQREDADVLRAAHLVLKDPRNFPMFEVAAGDYMKEHRENHNHWSRSPISELLQASRPDDLTAFTDQIMQFATMAGDVAPAPRVMVMSEEVRQEMIAMNVPPELIPPVGEIPNQIPVRPPEAPAPVLSEEPQAPSRGSRQRAPQENTMNKADRAAKLRAELAAIEATDEAPGVFLRDIVSDIELMTTGLTQFLAAEYATPNLVLGPVLTRLLTITESLVELQTDDRYAEALAWPVPTEG